MPGLQRSPQNDASYSRGPRTDPASDLGEQETPVDETTSAHRGLCGIRRTRLSRLSFSPGSVLALRYGHTLLDSNQGPDHPRRAGGSAKIQREFEQASGQADVPCLRGDNQDNIAER